MAFKFSSYPKLPAMATTPLVFMGVILPVWWFGTADTWEPTALIG